MAKILIGTLYSGENEYEECLESIRSQTFQGFDHLIIENLPEREAHNKLYQSFLEQADTYQLLIKVDADMVLCSPDFFEEVLKRMEANPGIDVYTVAVYDYISGQLINGLNTYRNSVRWDFEKNTIFVDISETSEENSYFDQTELAPAAIHCKNPSNLQAFRYGVHRGLKSIQQTHSTTHWAFIEKSWQNFLKLKDPRIGLAVLGAELVYAGEFSKADIDYTNPKMGIVLEQYQDLDFNSIKREIQKLRNRNWGILPSDLRRRFVRWLRRSGDRDENKVIG